MDTDPLLPIFVCVACAILVALGYTVHQRVTLDRHGIRAMGEIVNLEMRGLDLLHRYPVIRFQTRAGQWVTVSASERVNAGEYSKGQKVEVIYLPTNPEQCRMVSELETLLRPAPPRMPSRLAKGQERRYAPNPGGATTNNGKRSPYISRAAVQIEPNHQHPSPPTGSR